MTDEQVFQMLTTGGPVLLITAAVLAFLLPVRSAVVEWIKSKAALLLAASCLLLAGCGTYSQARVDDLENNKRNHVQDVERAKAGKLTAVELRASLDSIDKAILAEYAHQGNDANLDEIRAKLEKASDDHVAALFDGDTGRSGSGPDGG